MKNKLVMIVLGVILVLAAGAMVYAIYSTQSGKEVFAEDGYIIVYDESDAEQPAKTYHFTEGTAFKRSYEGSIQFRDTEGKTVTADANSFVHYDSGASASLSKSVLVNLDEVGSSAVNYYGLNADTSVNRSGSSYSIDTSDSSSVDLTNYLWKVGNNRYMMVSDVITVSFADGESYTFDDYVELIYQEGGMVSIINGDTMLRDASKNTYVSTDTGIKINLATQVVLDDDNIAMTLGQMTTDSDQVVSVLPADVPELKIIIPQFNFEVIDGKNGEDGPNGINGSNGADGDSGADGLGGESGRTGLMGYDGDDGEAGQAGTSGRSGINGVEGAEGADGAQGSAGAAGPSGGQGAAGSSGSAGGAGASGAAGNPGNQGNRGDDGADGQNVNVQDPTEVLSDVPMLKWESLDVHYSQISGYFKIVPSIGDVDATLNVTDLYADLIEISTGKVVKRITLDPMNAGGSNQQLTIDGLNPATAYRLRIVGKYDYKNKPVEHEFEDITVITDDFPLSVNVYGAETTGITMELINRDADADENTTTVTRTFSVDWELTDSRGTSVQTGTMQVSQSLGGSGTTVVNKDRSTSDFLKIDNSGQGLTPDTLYYFTVKAISDALFNSQNQTQIPDRYKMIPVKTLKRIPEIDDVVVVQNILNSSFDFSVNFVFDPDHAITGFRYDVYNESNQLVKSVHAPNSDVVHCYLDPDAGLNESETYTVRAIAEVYDNHKKLEIEAVYLDPFSMNGVKQYTWLTLENKPESLHPNALGVAGGSEAQFQLHIPGTARLKENESVTIEYAADLHDNGVYTYDYSTFKDHITTDANGAKVVPINAIIPNLKSSTLYRFTAIGMVDLTGDGVYKRIAIGTVPLKTPKYTTTAGNMQPGTNGTSPIWFTFSLKKETYGLSAEDQQKSQYSVTQASDKFTWDADEGPVQGKAHVELWDSEGTTKITEKDVNLKQDTSGSETIAVPDTNNPNNYLSLDDFPGNPSISSFGGHYRVKITEAYDYTSHKNIIPVHQTDPENKTEIGKTYPDPRSLSLLVTPITKDNYTDFVANAPNNLSEFRPDTVFGYVVRPNGIGSNLKLFDRIDFYAYDAEYYASTMKPISDALKSSNPPAGTTLTAVSNEGNADVQGTTYFYPYEDNHFASKVSINLKKTGALLADPHVIFLFDDFTGDKAASEAALLNRTTGLPGFDGYTVTTAVKDDFANGKFFRGRDYEFTFRLHVDHDEMTDANNRMYPEVLGEDKACILKAPTSFAAPYEEPSYYFYPADSGSNYLTYGYYIQSKDAGSIFSGVNMEKTAGTGIKTRELTATPQEWRDVSTAPVIPNADAQVRVDGLSKNSQVIVRFTENRYIASYNRGRTVTAFTRLFIGKHETPNATFKITPSDPTARVEFDLTFDTAAQAKSVTAVVGTFTNVSDSGKTTDKKLTITSVSGVNMHGYVQYADLASVKGGSGITASLKIYYDTGIEGFQQTDSPYSTTGNSFVCIREAGENNEGQYILPMNESAGSEFQNRNLTSQDIIAEGSLFTMNLVAGAGAQNGNIKDTLSNEPGRVSVSFYGYDGKSQTGFTYESGPNARARLGGMYDVRITKSLLDFTVCLVKNDGTSKGATSGSNNEEFNIGDIVPMVNLHTKTGLSISPGQDNATVNFSISGVLGATQMYGREGASQGRVYLLLYKSAGGYTPVIDNNDGYTTHKIRRIPVELTQGTGASAGDGDYTKVIDKLEPNTSYAIQLVYYKTADDFNADIEYDAQGNATADHRVYLRDALFPGDDVVTKYYHFSTTTTINIDTQVNMPVVTYSSTGYGTKKVNVAFSLAANSPSLRPGEQYIYALYYGNNLVLDHREIEQYMTQTSSRNVSLDVSPDRTLVGRENSKNVYLHFDSAQDLGRVNKYKLRIIPIRTSDLSNFNVSETQGWNTGNYSAHTSTYQTAYENWLSLHSIGRERGGTGEGVYAEFNNLSSLSSPFYNIRAYSGKTKVTFRVSIVDADGVILKDNYMVRAFKRNGNDLVDCTPAAYVNSVLSTRYAQQIVVDGLSDEQEVVLKVFAVEDEKSRSRSGLEEIYYYRGNFGTPATVSSDVTAGHYVVKESTEKSTPADGFSHGFIEAVRGAYAGDAYIDFVNMSNPTFGTEMRINMTTPSNVTRRFDDYVHPFAEDTHMCDVITTQTGDTTYRFTKLDEGVFDETGTYTIAIRIKVQDGDGHERYDDSTITYTIA